MKKISVLMSVHNPKKEYFEECLQAIEEQTYKDFELIIVDDGSNNSNVEEYLLNYSFDYKIIKNPQNLGLARSLNNGLHECSGEYIARIDDDDVMMPERLEKQLAFAIKQPGIIFSDVILIDDSGRELSQTGKRVTDIKKYLRKNGNCLTHSTLFVKKSILESVGGYDERFIYAQDYALYMTLLDQFDFYQLDECLVKYRVPTNRSTMMKKVLSILSCYGAAVNYFSRNRNFSNCMYFFRRSFGLMKLLFGFIKKG